MTSPGPARSTVQSRSANRVGELFDAFAADCRNLASAENLRRDEDDYLINDSGAQRAESQIRPAFQEEALDLAALSSAGKRVEAAAESRTHREILEIRPRRSRMTRIRGRRRGSPLRSVS